MSQRGLEALLRPKSIAVIGASMKPNRAGYLMMRNLLAGGFNGPVLPVTPAWKAVLGVLAWPNISSLPFSPDLAVLCTNASRNLALLEALGEKGCKTCIILSAPAAQHAELLACASRYKIRLLGPNSLGLLAPWQGLNASFSPVPIKRGKLAFISQSAAVSNTILDWAQQREMGFSYFIALGDSLDIDVDELLDYLARDSKTSAILLYLEHLSDARRFVSAARSAARNKPILVEVTSSGRDVPKAISVREITFSGTPMSTARALPLSTSSLAPITINAAPSMNFGTCISWNGSSPPVSSSWPPFSSMRFSHTKPPSSAYRTRALTFPSPWFSHTNSP